MESGLLFFESSAARSRPHHLRQLQEIIYRALERDPKSRYASAHEFAWDLQHQDQVAVPERVELRDGKLRRPPWTGRILSYVGLVLLPVVVFGLVLLVAAHK